MIIKCKKIRDIEKSTCTAEQKIAYNFAFRYADLGKKILATDTAEFVKADGFHQVETIVRKDIESSAEMKKYNIDAITIAFRNGFKNYCKNPFIALNYETIGNCFKIPYTIE